MIRKTIAYLAATLIMTTAVPAITPAIPAQAKAYVQAEQSVSSLSQTESSKFVKKDGKTYCYNSKGVQQTGWVKKSGKWYYFDKKSGEMAHGWLFLGNRKFYLRKTNGSMLQGPRWYKISGKKYFFTNDGNASAAWKKEGGKWYYISEEGNIVKKRWILYDGNYYYLKKDGTMATGTVKISGSKYTFGSNGDLLGKVPEKVVAAAGKYAEEAKTASAAFKKNYLKKLAAAAKKTTAAKTSSSAATTAAQTTAATSAAATTATTTAAATTTTTPATTTTTTPATTTTTTTTTTPATTTTTTPATTTTPPATTTTTATTTAATTNTAITKVVGKLNNVSESRRKFVINIATYVRKYAPQYGVLVYSPVIAQAIHESGWGESSLAYKYHNYFGLKCGTLWKGKSVNLSTKEEYSEGTLTTIRDNFRVYDNMEQGVKGYFEFLFKDRTRYNNLKGVTNPRTYLQNIKNDGYATGSLYVDHTMTVLNLYNLTQFDK